MRELTEEKKTGVSDTEEVVPATEEKLQCRGWQLAGCQPGDTVKLIISLLAENCTGTWRVLGS